MSWPGFESTCWSCNVVPDCFATCVDLIPYNITYITSRASCFWYHPPSWSSTSHPNNSKSLPHTIHYTLYTTHHNLLYTIHTTLKKHVRVHSHHTQHTHCNIPALDIFNRAGIKKAKVFPEPVIAMPITSLPDSRGGQHWAWGREEEKMWGGEERRGEERWG